MFGNFCVHAQIKNQDFSYLLFTIGKKLNTKLSRVGFPHIVLFRFKAEYKPSLELNLDMDPNPSPDLEGSAAL